MRRTWSPKGRTPVLTGFGRHRDKVSTIAAITAAPNRRRLGLYWRTDPEHYIDATAVVAFLRRLLRRLRGRVIVVWDGGSNHKGPAIRELLRKFPRLHLERLPGYAPDLNPWDEGGWHHLKHVEMRNLACRDLEQLHQEFYLAVSRLRQKPHLVQSFFAQAGLKITKT